MLMSESNPFVLFDSVKGIKINGDYNGSIISKCKDKFNSIIFSDNINILDNGNITIKEGLMVGFDTDGETNKKVAFSRKLAFDWTKEDNDQLEYSLSCY